MRRYPVPAIVVVGGGRYLMELVDLPLKKKKKEDDEAGAILGAQQQIKVIGESLDLVKYVDSNFEGPSLLPDDPEKRKFAEELIAYSDTTFVPKVYRPFTRDARTLSGEI
uniref:Glutathione S-transferase omega n=1 Tax=Solanum tuberosum TaxID=4113 RepID=M1DE97_SOLTU